MKTLKKNIFIILVLVLTAAAFLVFGRAKAGYFIDEIHTYGLSNSHYAPYISDVAGGSLVDTEITRDELIDYATVNDGQYFDYGSVYYNQSKDVHPPLYYFIFNTVSGIAGENFTKWTGLALNLVIYLAAVFVFYRLCLCLFGGNARVSAATALLYGLSTIGISTAVYIRMSVLLMFFTVLLAFFALKLISTMKYRYCLLYGLCVFLGVFTQYYFVFYAFFLTAALCIYLFVRKEYGALWRLACCAAAGVALLLLVFPAAIDHIFGGNGKVVGGGAVLSSITDLSSYGARISAFVHFLTHGLKAAVFVTLAAAVYLAVILIRNRKSGRKQKLKYIIPTVILVVPAVLAWCVNIMVCPENTLAERYVYNIAPLFVLVPGWIMAQLNFKFDIAVCAGAVIASLILCKPSNLTSEALEYNKILSEHSNAPVVYITDDHFEPLTYDFQQLLLFDNLFTTNNTGSGKMLDYVNSSDCDEIVIFIDQDAFWSSGYDPEDILPALMESTGYKNCIPLYSNGFSGAYLLRKD